MITTVILDDAEIEIDYDVVNNGIGDYECHGFKGHHTQRDIEINWSSIPLSEDDELELIALNYDELIEYYDNSRIH